MSPPWYADQAKTGATVSCVLPSQTFRMSSAPGFSLSQLVQYQPQALSSKVRQRSSTAPIVSHVSASPLHVSTIPPTDPHYRLPILRNHLVLRHKHFPPTEHSHQRTHQFHQLAQVSDGGERPSDCGSVRAAVDYQQRREAAPRCDAASVRTARWIQAFGSVDGEQALGVHAAEYFSGF